MELLSDALEQKAMTEKPPIVLTIAGFDPSSGAGVTADIKTIAAHGCYGVACITAMTVQSTAGVKRVEAVDPSLISETLEELAADLGYCCRPHRDAGIGQGGQGCSRFSFRAAQVARVGQLASAAAGKGALANIVLDPVLKSSSGAALLDAAGTKLLVERLIPLATW